MGSDAPPPASAGGDRSPVLLLFLGLGIALAWALAVGLARAGRNPILVYNGAFAVAFALYLAAGALVLRRVAGPGAPAGRAPDRRLLGLILGLALLPRLILLASSPALSDDLYRYIWDGKVAAAGIDPYRYAPDAPELAALRGPLWGPVNQKAQRTPYPPAAELVFAATYRIAPDSVKAQQVVATGADLLAIGALLLLLGRLGLPLERALLYAWSPTPALHFAHSAHNDALMIAPLLLALALANAERGARSAERRGYWPRGRSPSVSPFRAPRSALRVVSGLALAFAALVKLVPLLAAPLLLRRWRLIGALAFGAGMVALAAPYARSGAGALAGLGTEAGASVFNDSLHYLLVRALGPTATGLLSALALATAAVALAVWGGRGADGPARGVAFLFGLALLLNAVVEPWYLTWMLPFVALFLGERGARGEGRSLAPRPSPLALSPLLGWLWLSGAVQLTDLTYLGPGVARWWPLIRAVEYGPLFALLAWDGLRQLRLRLARRAAPETTGP